MATAPTPFGVSLSDSELTELNALLPWFAGAPLPDGRILGRPDARPGKRSKPEAIPDRRILALNEVVPLQGLRVLELGCFEGIHTVALSMLAGEVTAVDLRPVNVVKTLTRLSYHGLAARVFQLDVERLDQALGTFDLVFHCGVLYHLRNPAEHLLALGSICRALFIDSHVALDEKDIVARKVGSVEYRGAFHVEGGWADPFSGRDPTAFWLTEPGLLTLLDEAGFRTVSILERRAERNGPRLALVAQK